MYSQNVRDENGETFIPASQRPDGTWRKARRVKEGYVPQEEVPLYESKGKQFASRSAKPQPVTLPSGHVAHQAIPGLFILDDKEKSKSKKKVKNAEEITKRLDQVKLTDSVAVKTQSKSTKSESKGSKPESAVQKPVTEQNNAATDPAKRIKNLKKRLREVEALEEKLKNGQIPKPEPEQLAKIQRKNDLLLQIRELEKLVV